MATNDSKAESAADTPSTPPTDKKTAEPTQAGHGLPVDDGSAIPVSERQHVSGYGGKGGEPKSSSDQREPQRPD